MFSNTAKKIHFNFKDQYTTEQRIQKSTHLMIKYPTYIPVICEVFNNDKQLVLDKTRYITPGSITVGQFLYTIRKRIKLDASSALFVFTESTTIPSTGQLMSELHAEHKSDCNFLYLKVSKQSTFG